MSNDQDTHKKKQETFEIKQDTFERKLQVFYLRIGMYVVLLLLLQYNLKHKMIDE